jgi:tetratricopeptide (TPR) repeat protein
MINYIAALTIRQKLVAAHPSNTQALYDLSLAHEKLGNALRAQGNMRGALSAFREALAIQQRLMAADPSNLSWQRDLGVSYERLGDVLRLQGDLPAALAAFRERLAISERLALADPSNAPWQRDWWVSCWRMAEITEQARAGNALQWFQKAHDILAGLKRRGLLSPQDDQFLAKLAGMRG